MTKMLIAKDVEIPSQLNSILWITDVWKSGQDKLPDVMRWEKYHERGGCRPQNSLQHSYSIMVAASIARQKLKPHLPKFDWELLMDCLLIHDHGEGELGTDTLYHLKNDGQDVSEFEAFSQRFRMLDPSVWEYLEKAFLLQFCLKSSESFHPIARQIMAALSVTHRLEALLFDAIERWDYMLYVFEQYAVNNNLWLLVGVAHQQIPRLQQLANMIPGFGQEIWTPAVHEFFEDLVEDNQPLLTNFLEFIKKPDQK